MILFSFYQTKGTISSDITSTFPASLDILEGNFLLKGWQFETTNFYFTEIIPFAIGHILGFSIDTLLQYMPSIAWAASFTFLLYFLDVFSLKNLKEKCIFIILVFSFLVVMPSGSLYNILNANSHNNLYAMQMVWLVLLKQYLNKGNLIYLFIMTVLAGLLSFSEGVILMTLFAPVGCVSLYRLVIKKDKKWFNVFSSLVISFLLGIGINIIFDLMGGLEVRGVAVGITRSGFLLRAIEWLGEMAVLIGVPEITLTSITMYSLFGYIVIFSLIVFLIYGVYHISQYPWHIQICIAIAIVNFTAALLTNVDVVYRYIVPGWFFGYSAFFMVLARKVSEMKNKTVTRIAFAGLSAISLYNVCKKTTDIINAGGQDMRFKQVADAISNRNIGVVYSDFWIASLTEYYGNYDISVLPVKIQQDSQSIIAYDALVKKDWYVNNKDVHYILTYEDAQASLFINYDQMIQICGEPDDVITISPCTLYYWEDDISQYLNNGFDDFTVTPNEMGQPYDESDNTMIIEPQQTISGPGTLITKGNYDVTIVGDNLDKISVSALSRAMNRQYSLEINEVSSTEIRSTLHVNKTTNYLFLNLVNNSENEEVVFEKIMIKDKSPF